MNAGAGTEAFASNDAFVQRLVESLVNVGLGDSPTTLARAFNLRFPMHKISVHGARRWLVGETIPQQIRLECLAKWLDVAPSWLRYGELSSASELRDHAGSAPWPRDFSRLTETEKAIVNGVVEGLLALRTTR